MPITQAFLDQVRPTRLSSTSQIDAFFMQRRGATFIPWFNANVGDTGPWAGEQLGLDQGTQDNFNALWSSDSIQTMFEGQDISVLQFIALQCIIIHETATTLAPVTEKVGSAGHPEIAYAFDAIPGLKASYNTLPGNKTCLQLFDDNNYNTAFGSLAMGDQLKNSTDQAWAGDTYPDGIPTSTDPSVTGYILEADFFKFRGRGLIQTTGRAGYREVLDFVLSYGGDNAAVLNAKATWSTLSDDPDVVASLTRNAEWEDAFKNSNYVVPTKAISLHNLDKGDYLGNVTDADPQSALDSVGNVAKRINGGANYISTYKSRVVALIEALE
jgi:hypothetical protein